MATGTRRFVRRKITLFELLHIQVSHTLILQFRFRVLRLKSADETAATFNCNFDRESYDQHYEESLPRIAEVLHYRVVPQYWRDAQPDFDEILKRLKVREGKMGYRGTTRTVENIDAEKK